MFNRKAKRRVFETGRKDILKRESLKSVSRHELIKKFYLPELDCDYRAGGKNGRATNGRPGGCRTPSQNGMRGENGPGAPFGDLLAGPDDIDFDGLETQGAPKEGNGEKVPNGSLRQTSRMAQKGGYVGQANWKECLAECDSKVGRAKDLFNYGNKEEALKVLDQLVEAYPGMSYVYAVRASLNLRMRRWDDALRDCNAALDKNPMEVRAIRIKGMILVKRGEPKKALELQNKALMRLPNNAYLHWIKGRALLKLEDFKAAQISMSRAIFLAQNLPIRSKAYFLSSMVSDMGKILCKRHKFDKSLQLHQQAEKMCPGNVIIRKRMALTLFLEARYMLNQECRKPGSYPQVESLVEGKLLEAIRLFNQYEADLEYFDSEIVLLLARCKLMLGRFDDAEGDLERVMREAPQRKDAGSLLRACLGLRQMNEPGGSSIKRLFQFRDI